MRTSVFLSCGLAAAFALVSAAARADNTRYGVSYDGGVTFEPLISQSGGAQTLAYSTSLGNGYIQKSLTGGSGPAPIAIQFGPGDTGTLGWLSETFRQDFGQVKADRHTQLIAFEPGGGSNNGNAGVLLDCNGCRFSNVVFPALGGSSNGPSACWAGHLHAQSCGSNPCLAVQMPKNQNLLSTTNFQVSISGVDPNVPITGAIAVNVELSTTVDRGLVQTVQNPSDFVITIPASQAASYNEWLAATQQMAAFGLSDEQTGSISYFDTAGNPAGTLVLNGLGILSVAPSSDPDAGTDEVTMYVQSVQFNLG